MFSLKIREKYEKKSKVSSVGQNQDICVDVLIVVFKGGHQLKVYFQQEGTFLVQPNMIHLTRGIFRPSF